MYRKLFFCVLVVFLGSLNLEARHIIGGDVYYTCLGQDTVNMTNRYRIDVVMYRDPSDPNAANFDDDALFGIWRNTGGGYIRVLSGGNDIVSPQDVFGVQDVNIDDVNPCIIIPPNVAVERGEYSFEVTLPIIEGDYIIGYQRCCRNNNIFNIIDPQTTGGVFAIEITEEAQQVCNSSPRFNEFPPVVICNGLELEFDHSTTDPNGDLVIYEFCAPRASGGIDGALNNLPNTTCTGVTPSPLGCPPPWGFVAFQPPYSIANPLGGDPQVTIDPNTGLISGVPTLNGQFVVGVCAKEFRDGVLIGEIRRDFQFNVTTCEPTVFAVVEHDISVGDKEFVINSCGNATIDFDNQSFNEQYIVAYDWTFDINGTIEKYDTRDVTVTFPDVGEYEGRMIVNPDTDCADTATIFVNIYPEVTAEYSFQYDTCVAGPVAFDDQSFTGADDIVAWEWLFDDGNGSVIQDPMHQYADPGLRRVSLIAIDNNNCADTLTQDVLWQPAPQTLVVAPDRFIGCAPSDIFFNNLSAPIDSTYLVEWDFGDGNTSNEISPTHIYEDTGEYTVFLKVTSPIGCEIEKTFNNLILIKPKPLADFIYSPLKPNQFNSTVDFTDQSIDASEWLWNIEGEATYKSQNASHTFRDTGMYNVQLVVEHLSGCTDTAFALVDVEPQLTYFLPNAFSPNNDGKNDVFIGKGFLDGFRSFDMSIWNRWGEQIYTTDNPYIGWNGSKDNTGASAPQGVYVYVVNYVGPRGDVRELTGHVTLIK